MRFYKDRRGDKYERTIYLGTDADGPGMAALIGKEENWPAAKTYGPLSRLVNWQADRDRSTFEIRKPGERAAEIKVKDANEYLAALAQASEIAQAVKARVESQETPTATPDGAVAEQPVFVSTAAVAASESPTQPDPAAAEDGDPEETTRRQAEALCLDGRGCCY
jgi:DNA polymerase III gamma/tau subunit